MKIDGWKYYNHAVIPTTAPHEKVDLTPINNGSIWKIDGKPLFARWTSDFDCDAETNWWFIIREAPYSIDTLTSKSSRKDIRRALKRCNVIKINPNEYLEDLYNCYKAAYRRYKKADNFKEKNVFISDCIEDYKNGIEFWGGFDIETGILIGYMTVAVYESHVDTLTAKFWPEYMTLGVSDAIYHTILNYYLNILGKKYINGGSRNINHLTETQEYKERHFDYRKAYCRLHMAYNPKFRALIKVLCLCKRILQSFDNITFIHQINSVIKMQEFADTLK